MLLLLFLSCPLLLYAAFLRLRRKEPAGLFHNRHILLITAHPDDECMFFAPFIIRSAGLGATITLLCLTNGQGGGDGRIRESELRRAARRIGISRCIVVNDRRLPDSMQASWSDAIVQQVCSRHFAGIDVVVTFDSYGVSGHPNHRACSHVRFREHLHLRSVNLLWKYAGLLSLFVDLFHSQQHIFVLSPAELFTAYQAMRQHKSQLLWFRCLYLLFSRYMLINTFGAAALDRTENPAANVGPTRGTLARSLE